MQRVLRCWRRPRRCDSLHRTETKVRTIYSRHGKRVLDLALGIPLCLLATPVILAIAVMVVALYGWPPFYRGKRVGKGGREFSMWKIRTMVPDAERKLQHWCEADKELAKEYSHNFKLKNDPRITRLGRFLRRSSLDELPQLWNVLQGDMSLVGPRPIVSEELYHYRASAEELLTFRPGITGLWQVNGRNEVSYPERTWFELRYCRNASLTGDLRILVKTLTAPFRFNGL